MLILGIDPGVTGGCALIVYRNGRAKVVDHYRMPTYKKNTKTIIHAHKLDQWIARRRFQQVVVEDVASMPKQGVASTFTFGRALGAAESLAWARCEQIDWITPRVWKKELNMTGLPKEAAFSMCKEIFGWTLSKKVDIGSLDAALLAYAWAERKGRK